MTPSQTAHPTEGELLPCPFCGETDFAIGDVEDTAYFASRLSGGHAVSCPSCGTIGPSGSTTHKAITAWNTRPDLRPQGEEGLWRPISEAPRDGTPILVGNALAVFSAWWECRANGWADGTTNGYGDLCTFDPTAWQPLPEPPPALSNQGKASS